MLVLILLFGEYPTYRIGTNPTKVSLKKEYIDKDSLDDKDGPKSSISEIVLTKESDISIFVDALYPLWCRVVGPNSLEGFPMYHAKLYQENGTIKEYVFNAKEFDWDCSTPEEFLLVVDGFFNE